MSLSMTVTTAASQKGDKIQEELTTVFAWKKKKLKLTSLIKLDWLFLSKRDPFLILPC